MRYILFLAVFFSTCVANEITLRPAVVEDIDDLFELICDMAEGEGKDLLTISVTKENLLKFGFGKMPYFYIEVAENHTGIIAYALYSFAYSVHEGSPFLYIDNLYVKPDERNLGVETLLLKQLARYAQEIGCCRMEWHAIKEEFLQE